MSYRALLLTDEIPGVDGGFLPFSNVRKTNKEASVLVDSENQQCSLHEAVNRELECYWCTPAPLASQMKNKD